MLTQTKMKDKKYLTFQQECIIYAEPMADFTVTLPDGVVGVNMNFFIDIYDLDHHVHPEGHIGWWRFPLTIDTSVIQGHLHWQENTVTIHLEGIPVIDSSLSATNIAARRLKLIAVVRAENSNAIIHMDHVPVFRNREDYHQYVQAIDWNLPVFARSWFVPKTPGVVRIISKNIFPRDAVGNFCIDVFKLCQQNHIPAVLYAEEFDPRLTEWIRPERKVMSDTHPHDVIFYFHSIHDPYLPDIVTLNAKKIAYYHGITNPDLLRVFNLELSIVCRKGYEQLSFLSGFDTLASNSQATAAKLQKRLGSSDQNGSISKAITAVPPCLLAQAEVEDFFLNRPPEKSATIKLLYVGRIKSHKKIEDILGFFKHFLALSAEAECWLVGSQDEKAYLDYLRSLQNEYLGDKQTQVKWLGVLPPAELRQVYASATVYISMSEDEGFCLPLLEAMLSRLPVFAYHIEAVKEVLGEAGVYFKKKDFAKLAKHLYGLLTNEVDHQDLIARQLVRAKEWTDNMHGQSILRLIEPYL